MSIGLVAGSPHHEEGGEDVDEDPSHPGGHGVGLGGPEVQVQHKHSHAYAGVGTNRN